MSSGEAFWEFVKVAPGLASLAIVLADRLVKSTPTAYITVEPLLPGAWQLFPALSVTNNADAPIVLEWSNETLPNTFMCATENSTLAIVQMWTSKRSAYHMAPGETVSLPLMRPANYEDVPKDGFMEFTLEWRRVNPILYQGSRKLRRRISRRDYDHMTKTDMD